MPNSAQTASIRVIASSMSLSRGNGTVTSTRDQSRDMLTLWRNTPLAMLTKSPSNVRILVTRNVTSSTRPSTQPTIPSGPSRTTSPTPNWRSAMMYKPAITSPTICCAPKPRPAPAIDPKNTSAEDGRLRRSSTDVITTAITQKLMPQRRAPSTAARCAPVVRAERSLASSLLRDLTWMIC